jgi:hypothetical protein
LRRASLGSLSPDPPIDDLVDGLCWLGGVSTSFDCSGGGWLGDGSGGSRGGPSLVRFGGGGQLMRSDRAASLAAAGVQVRSTTARRLIRQVWKASAHGQC